MLGKADATPMIAVKDLDRARKFYEDTLGLKTDEEWGGEGVTLKSGDTLTPSNWLDTLRRFTNSIVRVASTSTNTLTCGAENFEATMFSAITLRTPFTGKRCSRCSSS